MSQLLFQMLTEEVHLLGNSFPVVRRLLEEIMNAFFGLDDKYCEFLCSSLTKCLEINKDVRNARYWEIVYPFLDMLGDELELCIVLEDSNMLCEWMRGKVYHTGQMVYWVSRGIHSRMVYGDYGFVRTSMGRAYRCYYPGTVTTSSERASQREAKWRMRFGTCFVNDALMGWDANEIANRIAKRFFLYNGKLVYTDDILGTDAEMSCRGRNRRKVFWKAWLK